MKLSKLTPAKALNKAYLKKKPNVEQINEFKKNLTSLFSNIEHKEREDHHKTNVLNFLRDTFLKEQPFFINHKNTIDLVIHNGEKATDSVGVLLEFKEQSNASEMMTETKPNAKALQELILYYLRERIENNNFEVKNLVVTNINEWFIFDANVFDKLIFKNNRFKKLFDTFKNDGKTTSFFYQEAEKLLNTLDEVLECTHFSIKSYQKHLESETAESKRKIVELYKILSPTHLLKLPFENDGNRLDPRFYTELLHIIGLEETTETTGSKKVIKPKRLPDEFSLLENTMTKVRSKRTVHLPNLMNFGDNESEQVLNIALELCITWVNRILFLKLLEGQLVKYHQGDKKYKFLAPSLIRDFDRLNKLFFQVLAEKVTDRIGSVKTEFGHIPYLNSSLFERTDLEMTMFELANLDDSELLPIHARTVLKDANGKPLKGHLPTLNYLLEFLDAYDFAAEGEVGIQEDGQKTLINAAVLGLIFEKINGYKDGAFFTPSFITMFMCRETIRRAVLQKFQENGYKSATFDDLEDEITNRKEANTLVNSLKICDPAVGSGHFLVSALNEIIALKSDLGILIYRDGKRVKDYKIYVENDELIVFDEDAGSFFEYALNAQGKPTSDNQKIQEMLFHEKQTIIENCLFGVDINPNSVKICRLRLWIELLKNAYYTEGSRFQDLETLPNIDINIKCGNSLISRFAIKDDVFETVPNFRVKLEDYKFWVEQYKQTTDKNLKHQLTKNIDQLKSIFKTRDPRVVKLEKEKTKLGEEIFQKYVGLQLFAQTELSPKQVKDKEKLTNRIKEIEREIEETRNNPIFNHAFEWRFEFPEVLNTEGGFEGFDVVIGNPPYIAVQKMPTHQTAGFRDYDTYSKGSDLYCLFYERGLKILKRSGLLTFITSNSWLRSQYGELLRKFFIEKANPIQLLNIAVTQIFEEATVESNILTLQNSTWQNRLEAATLGADFKIVDDMNVYFQTKKTVISDLTTEGWIIGDKSDMDLKAKIEDGSELLKEFRYEINSGIKTGFNPAFVIDEKTKNELIAKDPRNIDILKPILRGRDVSKYQYNFANLWIINTFNGYLITIHDRETELIEKEDGFTYLLRDDDEIKLYRMEWKSKSKLRYNRIVVKEDYPSIYEHLKQYEMELRKREDSGDDWTNLRNCAYEHLFAEEKIIWGELSDKAKFTFDTEGYHANNTIFFLTGRNLKYLLAILNSKLADWYFKKISTTSGMGTNRWLKYKIEQLPIKNIVYEAQEPIIALVNQILAAKEADINAATSDLERQIDEQVYALYGLDAEEIAIIEGGK